MRPVYLALLLAIVVTGSAGAQPPLNSTERRALPPAKADRLARADLLSILEPMKAFPKGMVRQVRSAWFETQPYGTEISGICGQDTLIVNYAPTEQTAVRENAPVQPYSLESRHHFLFTRKPSAKMLDHLNERFAPPWRNECDGLKNHDDGWFAATDAEQGLRGYLAFGAAADAVRSGRIEPSKCDLFAEEAKKGCARFILELFDAAKGDSVEDCSAGEGEVCYRIGANGDTTVTIIASKTEGAVTAEDIRSVTVEQYIVVT